jgi:crystallin alpha B
VYLETQISTSKRIMSLFPLLFSNWWEELDQPHHVRDQHFGQGLNPERLAVLPSSIFEPRPPHPAAVPPFPYLHRATHGPRSHYYRPWGDLLLRGDEREGGFSTVKSDKDKFHVALDVQQFTPEEINVKVVDKYVVVEGNHEEKQDDHGWISRKFTRRYLIPEQCNVDKIESHLSSDGVLSITVPRKEQIKEGGERVISIQKTGKPAITEKKSEEKKPEEK